MASPNLKAVLSLDTSPFVRGAARALATGKALAAQFARNPVKLLATGAFLGAEKAAAGLGRGISKLGNVVSGVAASGLKAFAVSIPLVGAALAAGVAHAYNFGSELQDMQDRTGIAVEKLVVLTQALKDSGVEFGALVPAIKKMQVALVGAAQGGSAKAFEQIGLHVSDLLDLDPGEQFERIGAAISKLENPAARAAAAVAVFGKSGQNLLSFFADGAAMQTARDSIGEQAKLLGDNAEQFDRISDRLGRVGVKLRGFFVGVAARLAPIMDGLTAVMDKIDLAALGGVLADKLKDAAKWIIIAIKEPQKTITLIWETMKLGAANFVDWFAEALANGIGKVWNAMAPGLAGMINKIIGMAGPLAGMIPKVKPEDMPKMETNHTFDIFGKAGLAAKVAKAREALNPAGAAAEDAIERASRFSMPKGQWIGSGFKGTEVTNKASRPPSATSVDNMRAEMGGLNYPGMAAMRGYGMAGVHMGVAGLGMAGAHMAQTGFAQASNDALQKQFNSWRFKGFDIAGSAPLKMAKNRATAGGGVEALKRWQGMTEFQRGGMALPGGMNPNAVPTTGLLKHRELESIRSMAAARGITHVDGIPTRRPGEVRRGDAARRKAFLQDQERKRMGNLTEAETLSEVMKAAQETAASTKKMAKVLSE